MNFICSVAILAGCNYQKDKAASSAPATSASLSSFGAINSEIIQAKCVRCHSGPAGGGGVDLSSYSAIRNGSSVVVAGRPSQSRLYTEVESGSMPLGEAPLSSTELAALSDWIQAGAPEGNFAPTQPEPTPGPTPSPSPGPSPTATAPPPTPTPTAKIRFADLQSGLFNKSCVGCHSGPRPTSQVDLSSYSSLMKGAKKLVVPGSSAQSLVFTEIESGNMPPSGTVSAQELKALRDWIDQGAAAN